MLVDASRMASSRSSPGPSDRRLYSSRACCSVTGCPGTAGRQPRSVIHFVCTFRAGLAFHRSDNAWSGGFVWRSTFAQRRTQPCICQYITKKYGTDNTIQVVAHHRLGSLGDGVCAHVRTAAKIRLAAASSRPEVRGTATTWRSLYAPTGLCAGASAGVPPPASPSARSRSWDVARTPRAACLPLALSAPDGAVVSQTVGPVAMSLAGQFKLIPSREGIRSFGQPRSEL